MTMIPYPDALGKWTLHKNAAYQQGTRLRNAGAAVGRKDIWLRGDIMRDCSSRIEYTYCQECGSLHIRRTNLCRDRLCPICAWRLSLQRIGDMMQTLEYLHQQRAHISAAMLTLTIKNVDADNLSNTISHMLHAWDRLLKRRTVQKWVTGYARSIEIRAHQTAHIIRTYMLYLYGQTDTIKTYPNATGQQCGLRHSERITHPW